MHCKVKMNTQHMGGSSSFPPDSDGGRRHNFMNTFYYQVDLVYLKKLPFPLPPTFKLNTEWPAIISRMCSAKYESTPKETGMFLAEFPSAYLRGRKMVLLNSHKLIRFHF